MDQLLAQEDLSKTLGDAARNLWPLVDHLGTVRDLAKQDGTIAVHYKYDSFGRVTSGDTCKTRYLFTSRELDPATGLQYNRARWYDSRVGRWVSEDPLGFVAGDGNLQPYVGNFSTSFTDPRGLEKVIGIHSSVRDPRARMISGHAWISVYDTETHVYHTYALYPDSHPAVIDNGEGSDVRFDVEKKLLYPHEHNRYKILPLDQERRLKEFVEWPGHWRYTNTCAAWASECWNEVTGEDVDPDDTFGFETPREISRSIIELEKKEPTGHRGIGGVPSPITPNDDGTSYNRLQS